MTDLDALIARIEGASEGEQFHRIYDCLQFALERKWVTGEQYDSAGQMLAVGAYESAALTLVPEGCGWTGGSDNLFSIYRKEERDDMPGWPIIGESNFAKTPALAICAAALRARREA